MLSFCVFVLRRDSQRFDEFSIAYCSEVSLSVIIVAGQSAAGHILIPGKVQPLPIGGAPLRDISRPVPARSPSFSIVPCDLAVALGCFRNDSNRFTDGNYFSGG